MKSLALTLAHVALKFRSGVIFGEKEDVKFWASMLRRDFVHYNLCDAKVYENFDFEKYYQDVQELSNREFK